MEFAVCFVRHGQYAQPPGVPSAHLPHPLVEEGRAQSRAGLQTLQREAAARGWTLCPVLDASPLLRAWETATLFAEGLRTSGMGDARVETFDALTERSLGAAANLTVPEIEAVIERDPRFEPLPPGWKRTSDFRLPFVGAESLREAGARVAAHVRRRAEQLQPPPGQGLYVKVVVGHGGSIRHAAAALGMLEPTGVDRLSMHHGTPIVHVHRAHGWEHVYGAWKQRTQASEDPH
ncbi:MAG: histidine phosphatase family protein [Nannocystaceae bacterium]|nr:histidine phosphatase family protein [bacterium]